jgi:Zn-dependent M16 (insulinase) family peptidase
VYLDAVLHPKCVGDVQTFQQEGWHLELDDLKDPLTFKGVVFNEMKGVYSSPDSMFYRCGCVCCEEGGRQGLRAWERGTGGEEAGC